MVVLSVDSGGEYCWGLDPSFFFLVGHPVTIPMVHPRISTTNKEASLSCRELVA